MKLDSQSSFSDNFTRMCMANESLLSMDTFNALVNVTRADGFSLKDIEDAKKIQANFAKKNDLQAEAFYGLIEKIIEGNSEELHRKSMVGLSEQRQNQLPSMAWVDNYAPNPKLIERYEAKALQLQNKLATNPKLGKKARVFHQKQVLAQPAKLTVRENLPSYAKAGPFARASEHIAVVRYSNGQGVPYRDKNPDVRAISIKFFPNNNETDLLMTSGPGLIARDIEEFIRVADVMVGAQEGDGEGIKGMVDAGEESIKKAMIGNHIHPFEAARMSNLIAGRAVLVPPSPAALQFWSSLVSIGGFAFKPTLVPAADNGSVELTVDPEEEHCLRKDLEGRINSTGLKYTLRLLFFTDDYATPLNDASAAWDNSPAQVDVADLEIMPTDGNGPTEEQIIAMPFNPNNGFDGLGITKARDEIYYAGARARGSDIPVQYRSFFVR